MKKFLQSVEPYAWLIILVTFLAFWIRIEIRLLVIDYKIKSIEQRLAKLEKLDYQVMTINRNAIGRNTKNVAVMLSMFPEDLRAEIKEIVESEQ